MTTCKGQLISKANCQAVNSSKKQTNEFVFTTVRSVFVRFLEVIEDTKKIFRNYLTFRLLVLKMKTFLFKICKVNKISTNDLLKELGPIVNGVHKATTATATG